MQKFAYHDERMSGSSVVVDFDEVSDLFRCLSSSVRVALISELTGQERCVHELVESLSLPQPLISQHLRVLRDADLVTRIRRGREVAYTLADEHVAHIVHDALTHTRESHDHDRHDRAPDS